MSQSTRGTGAKVAFQARRRYNDCPPGYRSFTAPCVSRWSRLLNGKGSSSTPRPDCFGPFRVRADLGASRFGPVYLGRDPSTNARVVIRTFEPSQGWLEFGEQSDLLDAFRKLCETTLDHPNLARPLAFGAEGDTAYLVYSDLAGTAMDVVMRQDGARPVSEVLQRAGQLADAIDSAASAGVHHGMMTPSDVILDGERTGVTGFGIAQALIKAGIPAEAGAPYASPQRLAGALPTRGDDIYSLAAITLELLIGTPADPDQDMSPALQEARGIPERRRIQRPAPHETRVFTTIAGVDAGKLRASFAAAFSEEPSERPSTASAFVASFQDAVSNKREAEEPAPSVVAVPSVSDDREDSRSAPVSDTKRAEDQATLALPPRQERVVAEKQETPEPIAGLALFEEEEEEEEEKEEEEVTPPPRASSIDEASYETPVRLYETPVQSGSRAVLVAVVVAVSFAAGFGGGFIVGQRSTPSTESTNVSRHEPVAEPQPARAAVEDPKPIASTTKTVATVAEEKVSSPEAIAATIPPQRAVPAVESGRLVVRSRPAGAGVTVDGQSRGVTPLALRDLALGAHTIEVSHAGHDTRRQRVTLSERRPARSVDVALRPTSVPGATAATTTTASLQVISRPSGAQVFVDDNLIGTTPLLLPNAAVGVRRLRLELSGYKIWTTSVQIDPSARSKVSASLEP